MKNYISNKVIGVDETTGLSVELRTKEFSVNAETRVITVKVDKVLVSPTGIEMKRLESMYYQRLDTETSTKYSQLEASPIGLGIEQILGADLNMYPDLIQN
jgi:hypothetical protein